METTQQDRVDARTSEEDGFNYECPVSGIRVSLAPDCVPRALHIPAPLFGKHTDQLARALVSAFADASAACQHHASMLPGDVESDFGSENVGLDDGPDSPPDFLGPGTGLDVDACLDRLHTVANCLTSAHHDLLTGTSRGSDPSNLVHASANSSGAITALTLSPLLASEGTSVAESAIVTAAAEAISAANNSRASVIEDALGTVLMNSLAQKWN